MTTTTITLEEFNRLASAAVMDRLMGFKCVPCGKKGRVSLRRVLEESPAEKAWTLVMEAVRAGTLEVLR
jgi:hypothetical protein